MASAVTPPDIQAAAVALREAGYSLTSIATRLDISISTTQRILKKHGAVAGATSAEVITRAREEMINTAYSLEAVQQVAASLVHDDLDLSQRLRIKAAEILDTIKVTPANSVQASRALAACATALKLSQDVQRKALPLDKLERSTQVEELSVLTIKIMTEDDVREMREQQRREATERIGGRKIGPPLAQDQDEIIEFVD